MIQIYRAAIFLNNIAINLLEQHAYRDALDTFTDSIATMRALMGEESVQPATIEAMIKNAQQRMARPRACSEACSFNVTVYDGYSLRQGILDKAESHTEWLLEASVVYIDWNEQVSVRERDIDLESAILLYNFSRAHLCLASIQESTESAHKLRTSAIRLLSLSYNIIAANNGLDRFGEEDRERVLEQRLRMSILVLCEVTNSLCEIQEYKQASETREKLSVLLELAEDITTDDEFMQPFVCAAAA